MLRNLLVLLVAGSGMSAQEIIWEKSYGGSNADYLFDVQPTPDYGFLLAGSSLSEKSGNKTEGAKGDLDYWLWKMDENGDPVWQKSYGGSGLDLLRSVRLTPDGGYILGGTSNSPKGEIKKEGSRGGNDFWIIKLNAQGGEEWQKTYGGSGQDDLASISPTRDGGYIVGGSSSSDATAGLSRGQLSQQGEKQHNSHGNMDYWILKLGKDGKIEWQKTYGGDYSDLLRVLIPAADGGYMAGGWSNSGQSGTKDNANYGSGGDYWILKLDKSGGIEWQQTIGGDRDDQLYAMLQTQDKGYIIGGSSASGASNTKSRANSSGDDLWLLKMDENGQVQWQETYNYGKADILTSLAENPDHSLMVGGYVSSEGAGKDDEGVNDFIALRVSATGEKIWDRTVGSDGQDILKKAILTRDGSYLLAGTSDPERDSGALGKKAKKDSKGAVTIGNGGNIAALDNAQKAVDETLQKGAKKVNDFVDKKVDAVTDKINRKLNPNKDSRLKLGVNGPTGDLLNLAKGGGGNPLDAAGGLLSGMGKKGTKAASRDKRMNFGGRDFWVVKLGTKERIARTSSSLEAYPNPTSQYVNIILDFEYEKGTISVFGLNGQQLQQFAITGSTVPVDLGRQPAGIYIITVTTDNGNKTVKVMKKDTK